MVTPAAVTGQASIGERARSTRGQVAATIALAREITAPAFPELIPLRVAWLATFTSDPIRPFLTVEGAVRGLALDVSTMPFNQLELQAFDAGSQLYQSRPDAIVVAARLEEVSPGLVDDFLTLTAAEAEQQVRAIAGRLQQLLSGIRAHTAVPVLLWNFAPPRLAAAGLADAGLTPSQGLVVAQANAALSEIAKLVPAVWVFDYARLATQFGLERLLDTRMWHRARLPFSSAGLGAVAERTSRYLSAIVRPPCKCLVLDLDNTLWGGVLGEDGPGGIKLGEDHPGLVFKSFQRSVLALRNRGILLALASKNDREDALAALASHGDAVLRPEHFAAVEIGWHDKATSLRRIASDLSIGTDALAFFDDSAVEREWIRSQLPEVKVIDVPRDPLDYVAALDDAGLFDILRISTEDRHRAEAYQAEAQRRELNSGQGSVKDFLKALEITAEVGPVDAATLPRVAQLLGTTNQFITTTRRHSDAQLSELLQEGAIAIWIRVRDKFGDSGLVGVAIAVVDRERPEIWRLDSLLLSCRVIGRGVETVLIADIWRRVQARGGRTLLGEFIPTAKNQPAASVFADHGFSKLEDGRLWAFETGAAPMPAASHIQTTVNE